MNEVKDDDCQLPDRAQKKGSKGISMKRDMDLIRQLLFKIESADASREITNKSIQVEGYDQGEIDYHINLLDGAGYLETIPAHLPRNKHWWIKGMTWKGHEFLDSARSDTVWKRTKEIVKEKGGSIPFEVLQSLLISVGKGIFGVE